MPNKDNIFYYNKAATHTVLIAATHLFCSAHKIENKIEDKIENMKNSLDQGIYY